MTSITPVYLESIPRNLENGKLYISIKFNTAIHLCCCGCGKEVVTPLKDGIGWSLAEENGKVSLYPSIGNWSLHCQSHYFIIENRVVWAEQWTPEMIAAGRNFDAINKKTHYSKRYDKSLLSNFQIFASDVFQSLKDFFKR